MGNDMGNKTVTPGQRAQMRALMRGIGRDEKGRFRVNSKVLNPKDTKSNEEALNILGAEKKDGGIIRGVINGAPVPKKSFLTQFKKAWAKPTWGDFFKHLFRSPKTVLPEKPENKKQREEIKEKLASLNTEALASLCVETKGLSEENRIRVQHNEDAREGEEALTKLNEELSEDYLKKLDEDFRQTQETREESNASALEINKDEDYFSEERGHSVSESESRENDRQFRLVEKGLGKAGVL